MAKFTKYDEKRNTLYINSNCILPDTSGMSIYEMSQANEDAFKMSYPDRIEKYASEDAKKEIYEELENHKGCKISEFCNI